MFIGSVRPVVPKIPLELCSSRECASGTCTCMSVGGRVVEPVLYCPVLLSAQFTSGYMVEPVLLNVCE